MHIQDNDITPTSSQSYMNDIRSLTNSTILAADSIRCCN